MKRHLIAMIVVIFLIAAAQLAAAGEARPAAEPANEWGGIYLGVHAGCECELGSALDGLLLEPVFRKQFP